MAEKDDKLDNQDFFGDDDIEDHDLIMDNDTTIEAEDTVVPETQVFDIIREDDEIFNYDEAIYEVKGEELSFDEEDASLMDIEEMLEEIKGRDDNIPLDEVTDAEIVRYLDEGFRPFEEELPEEEFNAIGGSGKGSGGGLPAPGLPAPGLPAPRSPAPSRDPLEGAELLAEAAMKNAEAAMKNAETTSKNLESLAANREMVSAESNLDGAELLAEAAMKNADAAMKNAEAANKNLDMSSGKGEDIPPEEEASSGEEVVEIIEIEEIIEGDLGGEDEGVDTIASTTTSSEETVSKKTIEKTPSSTDRETEATPEPVESTSGEAAAGSLATEPTPSTPSPDEGPVSMEEINEILKEVEDLSLEGEKEITVETEPKVGDKDISEEDMDLVLADVDDEPSPPSLSPDEALADGGISLEDIDRILTEDSPSDEIEEDEPSETVIPEADITEILEESLQEVGSDEAPSEDGDEISLEDIDQILAQSEGEETPSEGDIEGTGLEYELEEEEAQEIDAWVNNLKDQIGQDASAQPGVLEEGVIEAIEVVAEIKTGPGEEVMEAVGKVEELALFEGKEIIEAVEVVDELPSDGIEKMLEGRLVPAKDEVLESVFAQADEEEIPKELAAALDEGHIPEGIDLEKVVLKNKGTGGETSDPVQLIVEDVELRIKEGTSVLVNVSKGSLISVWWKKK